MPSDSDVVRRAKGATKRTTRRTADTNGDSTKKVRKNRRLESRRRRVALTAIASVVCFTLVYAILFRRGNSSGIGNSDTERYVRAKALREAAVRGGVGGGGGQHGHSELPHHESPKHQPHEHKRPHHELPQHREHHEHQSHQRREHHSVHGAPSDDKADVLVPAKVNGMRYLDPRQLPPLPGEPNESYHGKGKRAFRGMGDDAWVATADSKTQPRGPKVDYVTHKYKYPEVVYEPRNDGSYPPLEPMMDIFRTWEQDDLDNPPDVIEEVLMHFDYQDPEQLEVSFRLEFCGCNMLFVGVEKVRYVFQHISRFTSGCNQIQRLGVAIQSVQCS
jgi:hypothetical protein